jgi:hypothetical protein
MNPQDQQLPKIKCSAKSLGQTRNSCAQKELQSHGVEDGLCITLKGLGGLRSPFLCIFGFLISHQSSAVSSELDSP